MEAARLAPPLSPTHVSAHAHMRTCAWTHAHRHAQPPSALSYLPQHALRRPRQPSSSLFKKPHGTELSAPHRLGLSFPRAAFSSCCFWSLTSPGRTRGQAPACALSLVHLPGHLVGEAEQLRGSCSPAEDSGPSHCDPDTFWHRSLHLPYADLAEHPGHFGLVGQLVTVFQIRASSKTCHACPRQSRGPASIRAPSPAHSVCL